MTCCCCCFFGCIWFNESDVFFLISLIFDYQVWHGKRTWDLISIPNVSDYLVIFFLEFYNCMLSFKMQPIHAYTMLSIPQHIKNKWMHFRNQRIAKSTKTNYMEKFHRQKKFWIKFCVFCPWYFKYWVVNLALCRKWEKKFHWSKIIVHNIIYFFPIHGIRFQKMNEQNQNQLFFHMWWFITVHVQTDFIYVNIKMNPYLSFANGKLP